MKNDLIDSLKLLANYANAVIIREREIQSGVQISLSKGSKIVHVSIYNNGNSFVQGEEGNLKTLFQKWANKRDRSESYPVVDLPAGWREWNENAHWLKNYHKEHGLPDENIATHAYKIQREVMFHDYMFRNNPGQDLTEQNLGFVIKSWMKRFCFMNMDVESLIHDVLNHITTSGYIGVTLDAIPLAVAADAISYIMSGYCPNKFIKHNGQFCCPQVKSDHFGCVVDLVDSIYPYCTNQQILAYTKGNMNKLLKYDYNLKWYDIAPSTPIEEKMADGLKSIGIVNIPQFQAHSAEHRYKIDFVVKTRNGLSIAIECDGLQFHARPSTYMRDRVRDRYLQQRGFYIMRFSSVEIFNEIDKCIAEIDKTFWDIQKGRISFNSPQRLGYFGVLED
ncbi:endonuclease domain-containing protein [Hymenobacter sp. BT559]|uniref:endonuclease domain-containing protein n=1 Tax=Hymenobacter sp. BT559 TaxID=2795729 RepID=UPI0018ED1545|nr:DUF559 domain-containing protein [Hymenobacter sp. BT559]MBJ6145338.1 DUF559 domain-containing protein [Hymenobacter sp. BT559]